MNQKLNFSLSLPLTLYQLEDLTHITKKLLKPKMAIYAWKTEGKSNWLEKGISVSDVLGFVILPKELPDVIELPNDRPERTTILDYGN